LPDIIKEGLGPAEGISQGIFDTRIQFSYRSSVNESEGLFVILARIRTGIFIWGALLYDERQHAKDDIAGWRPALLDKAAQGAATRFG
jgi:hypothetical protein